MSRDRLYNVHAYLNSHTPIYTARKFFVTTIAVFLCKVVKLCRMTLSYSKLRIVPTLEIYNRFMLEYMWVTASWAEPNILRVRIACQYKVLCQGGSNNLIYRHFKFVDYQFVDLRFVYKLNTKTSYSWLTKPKTLKLNAKTGGSAPRTPSAVCGWL